jgi:hypothetical protein
MQMDVSNWRQYFEAEGNGWAIEDAERLLMTTADNRALDPMEMGYDASSGAKVLEALEWLHAEKNIPIPD